MKIFQIMAVALVGVSFAVMLRPVRPELSMIVACVTGLITLLFAVGEWSGLIDTLRGMAASYGVDTAYVGVLLKILGIAYAAQFGAQVCADAGEKAVAGKVELCGRILILAAALPAAIMTLSTAIKLLRSLP